MGTSCQRTRHQHEQDDCDGTADPTGLTADGYFVNVGSSFMMVMEFTENGPKAEAVLKRAALLDRNGQEPLKTLVLDTGVYQKGTRGLIGMALHPQFQITRSYFVAKHHGNFLLWFKPDSVEFITSFCLFGSIYIKSILS